jgi:hypothetical protein
VQGISSFSAKIFAPAYWGLAPDPTDFFALMQKSQQKRSRLRLLRTKNYACRRKKSELAPHTCGAQTTDFFYRPLHLFFGSPADARRKTNRPQKNVSDSQFEFFSKPYLLLKPIVPQHL